MAYNKLYKVYMALKDEKWALEKIVETLKKEIKALKRLLEEEPIVIIDPDNIEIKKPKPKKIIHRGPRHSSKSGGGW